MARAAIGSGLASLIFLQGSVLDGLEHPAFSERKLWLLGRIKNESALPTKQHGMGGYGVTSISSTAERGTTMYNFQANYASARSL